jgi:hypothetical protein
MIWRASQKWISAHFTEAKLEVGTGKDPTGVVQDLPRCIKRNAVGTSPQILSLKTSFSTQDIFNSVSVGKARAFSKQATGDAVRFELLHINPIH